MEARGELLDRVLSQIDEIELEVAKATLEKIANIMIDYAKNFDDK